MVLHGRMASSQLTLKHIVWTHNSTLQIFTEYSRVFAGFPSKDPVIPSPRSFHGVKICSVVKKNVTEFLEDKLNCLIPIWPVKLMCIMCPTFPSHFLVSLLLPKGTSMNDVRLCSMDSILQIIWLDRLAKICFLLLRNHQRKEKDSWKLGT